jgi:ParB family chromosome partitioning protein
LEEALIAFAKPSNLIDFPQPQGKSNEWYTPARYIEAAREVMGGIDLDPASCKEANMVVRAERFYTKAENGLMLPWHGRVWLNPPFSDESTSTGPRGAQAGATTFFVEKLIREFRSGNVKQAVLLVNAKHDLAWFDQLWAFPICFARRKVRFFRPKIGFESHMFGTCFVYLGPHEQKFIDTFSKFGTIAKRVSQPRQTVQPLSLWEVS